MTWVQRLILAWPIVVAVVMVWLVVSDVRRSRAWRKKHNDTFRH